MKIHLKLNEDHLKLLRFVGIEDERDDFLEIDKKAILCVKSHLLDDVAIALGMADKAIKGTEEDPDGRAYPDDVEKYLLDTYNYVKDNIYNIETLLHQRCTEGIQPGHYMAIDNELIWQKVEED